MSNDYSEINWSVSRRNVYFIDDFGDYREVKGHHVIVRDDRDVPLSVTSDRYHPLQNQEIIALAQELVCRGILSDINCHAFQGGKYVCVTGQNTGKAGLVTPNDEVRGRLALFNGHFPGFSAGILFTNLRIACLNMLTAAIRGAANNDIVRLPHHSNVQERWEATANIILETGSEFDAQLKTYHELSKVPITKDLLAQLVVNTFKPDIKHTDDGVIIPECVDKVLWAYEHGVGAHLENTYGTLWGGYNAITYYLSNMRGIEGLRFQSSLVGSSRLLRNRAYELAVAQLQ